jgi:hypothetical protein
VFDVLGNASVTQTREDTGGFGHARAGFVGMDTERVRVGENLD